MKADRNYYRTGKLQVIDVIERFNLTFHQGTIVQYIIRCYEKHDDPVEDLEKASWYLNRMLRNARLARKRKLGETK